MNKILVSVVGVSIIMSLLYKHRKDERTLKTIRDYLKKRKDQFKDILNKAKDQSDYNPNIKKSLDDISAKLDEVENIIKLARSVMM